MLELVVRLAVAVLLIGVSWLLKKPEMDIAFQGAFVFALSSVGAYWAETLGKRKAGLSGLIAVGDAVFIASMLSAAGQLDRFGFLVLAPMMWATGRFGSDAASMAPLVAASVMVSSNLFGQPGFTLPVMMHTLGILVIGLLTNQAKVIVKETTVTVPVTKEVVVENEADGKVRESFHSLKEHMQQLEKTSLRDRTAMKLWSAAHDPDVPPVTGMARKLADETGVEGLVVYTADLSERKFVVSCTVGKAPQALLESAIEIPNDLGDAQLRHRIDKQLLHSRDADHLVQVASVVLKDKGKLVGLVCLFHPALTILDRAFNIVHDVAESMGGLVRQVQDRDSQSRRLKEAEVLYGVASVVLGAESRNNLVARVVRDLFPVLKLDHLAVHLLDGDDSSILASAGSPVRMHDDMSFANGPGLSGWLATGAPEVAALDTGDDQRIDRREAIKSRVGSFVMVPLGSGSEPIGFLTAATHRVNGIDSARLETLRTACGELGLAMARLGGSEPGAQGWMAPKEFYESVRRGGAGSIVRFECPRLAEVTQEYGELAIELAMRKVANRLRLRLTPGGGLCRRDEGDLIAYLPGESEEFSRRWANESVAAISALALRTPDGRSKLPLSFRPKVAAINQQNDQISTGSAA